MGLDFGLGSSVCKVHINEKEKRPLSKVEVYILKGRILRAVPLSLAEGRQEQSLKGGLGNGRKREDSST